jgi:hypothetical protein
MGSELVLMVDKIVMMSDHIIILFIDFCWEQLLICLRHMFLLPELRTLIVDALLHLRK